MMHCRPFDGFHAKHTHKNNVGITKVVRSCFDTMGFSGLFLATAMDYLLELLGVKPTGTWVPIWYPVRLLAHLQEVFDVRRFGCHAQTAEKADETSTYSTPSDWAFLILLWLGGLTGFVLEVAIYLPQPHAWSYWMLLAHLIVVGELLILLPFRNSLMLSIGQQHCTFTLLSLYRK